ncbi:MAG: NfeD family protein [Frankiaceae bacterium]|nr:NfeD family protein [Frankiaceae bacterium]
MDSDLVWLVAGIGLLLAELFTLTVVLGLLGIAALVTALVAALGAGAVVQAIAFAGSSTALLVFARSPVQRMLSRGDDGQHSDARALAGSTALVIERVSDDTGQVRLNGELWRARPYAGGAPLEAGRTVSVAGVEGATLLVYSPDLS